MCSFHIQITIEFSEPQKRLIQVNFKQIISIWNINWQLLGLFFIFYHRIPFKAHCHQFYTMFFLEFFILILKFYLYIHSIIH